jgi:serine/threonine-protein phosphatase 4 regulatory subunit 2
MEAASEPLQETLPGNGTAACTAAGSASIAELCSSRSARTAALASFANSAQEGQPGPVGLSDELELVVKDVALTGDLSAYPWEDLRVLLVRKMDMVLREFWEDVKDVQVKTDVTFVDAYIHPLSQSLMKPLRDGAPFTVQRLCELLVEPRKQYKSTRKFLYAVQRMVTVYLTEDEIIEASNSVFTGEIFSAAAMRPPVPANTTSQVREVVGQKRKLPEELCNGIVEAEAEEGL